MAELVKRLQVTEEGQQMRSVNHTFQNHSAIVGSVAPTVVLRPLCKEHPGDCARIMFALFANRNPDFGPGAIGCKSKMFHGREWGSLRSPLGFTQSSRHWL